MSECTWGHAHNGEAGIERRVHAQIRRRNQPPWKTKGSCNKKLIRGPRPTGGANIWPVSKARHAMVMRKLFRLLYFSPSAALHSAFFCPFPFSFPLPKGFLSMPDEVFLRVILRNDTAVLDHFLRLLWTFQGWTALNGNMGSFVGENAEMSRLGYLRNVIS